MGRQARKKFCHKALDDCVPRVLLDTSNEVNRRGGEKAACVHYAEVFSTLLEHDKTSGQT